MRKVTDAIIVVTAVFQGANEFEWQRFQSSIVIIADKFLLQHEFISFVDFEFMTE